MSVDEVVERATIKFKRPLSLDETRELFRFIARKLPCDFHYEVKTSEGIYGLHTIRAGVRNRMTGIEIYGDMFCSGVVGLGGFECRTYRKNPLKIEAFSFAPLIEDRIEDYRPEVVNVWDAVREQINNYFKRR